ncbi:hypothetical protein [Paenibacillus ginsengarvi]|nr:hypothetical protein [Paenibacillus ginsengarvi]
MRINEVNRLQQQIIEMNRTSKEQQNWIDRQNVTMDRVKRLTEMKSFSYTVLAEGTSKNKKEKVVYVSDVPDSTVDQETYLLRASIEFANEPEFTISLWRDKELAIRYSKGDYDEKETIIGWSGFRARFGVIRQSEEEHRLLLFLSMDDIDNLEFGKYTNQER